MKDLTWYYLRESYYPQFKEGVTKMPWDERFNLLRELYDAKDELPWEVRTEDPVADMMNWVAKKGDEAYFTFFCNGVVVNSDGSFKLHKNISHALGRNGLTSLADPNG
jgi:DNA-directed RNA polymerase subunit H (RpoH/RPB5)